MFAEEHLSHILKIFGEEKTKEILSNFVCEKNKEVEKFLIDKAISHEKHNLARTMLIFDKSNGNLVGYYSISIKSFVISSKISTSIKKKFFGTSQTNGKVIPAILIGQLGKNDAVKSSFTGTHLMDYIFRYIVKMHEKAASVIAYVEHDDKDELVAYYEKHGFDYFARKDEEERGLYCHMIKTENIIKAVKE